MVKMKWDKRKSTREYISNGWALGYDKANDKFKLQKRIKEEG